MNRWLLIRRLRGPAFLLMFGVTALLHEWHILSFGQSWPLYLVLAGVLALAERAAFKVPDPSQMPPQYPPYAGGYPQPQPPPSGWQTPSSSVAGHGHRAGAPERHRPHGRRPLMAAAPPPYHLRSLESAIRPAGSGSNSAAPPKSSGAPSARTTAACGGRPSCGRSCSSSSASWR